jgi:hypothetical protein
VVELARPRPSCGVRLGIRVVSLHGENRTGARTPVGSERRAPLSGSVSLPARLSYLLARRDPFDRIRANRRGVAAS